MVVRAKYDGRVFVPEERVNLPPNAEVTLEVQPADALSSRSGIATGEDPLAEFVGAFDSGRPDLCIDIDEHLAREYSDPHDAQ